MLSVDETVQVQEWNITNLVRLFKQYGQEGYGKYEAIQIYDEGIDWHELERLLANGCKLQTAVEILK